MRLPVADSRRWALPLVLVGVLLLVAAAVGIVGTGRGGQAGGAQGPSAVVNAASAPADTLSSTVLTLQQHLRTVPRDYRGWATLGLAYVEQARITSDPTYYTKSDRVLAKAMAGAPDDDLVLTARAALAAARHDFSEALRLTDAALKVNAFSAKASAVRADALTELGRYDEALDAATTADRIQPSTSTFARLSYARELRGDRAGGATLMQRAADVAGSPADVAFAHYQLGELARGAGDLPTARREYDASLVALPDYAAALAGNARVTAAEGRSQEAISAYEDVLARLPLPQYVIELGELYQSLGQTQQATAQYEVVRAGEALAAANGVNVDLESALFEADHGDPATALTLARREWGKRHSIAVADALAWALHANGADEDALGYARQAARLGTRDARMLFHRGIIELAAGRRADAERFLADALALDPHFSPLQVPVARKQLELLRSAS